MSSQEEERKRKHNNKKKKWTHQVQPKKPSSLIEKKRALIESGMWTLSGVHVSLDEACYFSLDVSLGPFVVFQYGFHVVISFRLRYECLSRLVSQVSRARNQKPWDALMISQLYSTVIVDR